MVLFFMNLKSRKLLIIHNPYYNFDVDFYNFDVYEINSWKMPGFSVGFLNFRSFTGSFPISGHFQVFRSTRHPYITSVNFFCCLKTSILQLGMVEHLEVRKNSHRIENNYIFSIYS